MESELISLIVLPDLRLSFGPTASMLGHYMGGQRRATEPPTERTHLSSPGYNPLESRCSCSRVLHINSLLVSMGFSSGLYSCFLRLSSVTFSVAELCSGIECWIIGEVRRLLNDSRNLKTRCSLSAPEPLAGSLRQPELVSPSICLVRR